MLSSSSVFILTASFAKRTASPGKKFCNDSQNTLPKLSTLKENVSTANWYKVVLVSIYKKGVVKRDMASAKPGICVKSPPSTPSKRGNVIVCPIYMYNIYIICL